MWDQLCELNDLLIQRRKQAKSLGRVPSRPLPKLRHPHAPLIPGLFIFPSILWLTLVGQDGRHPGESLLILLALLPLSIVQFPATAYDIYQRWGRPFRWSTVPRVLWHALACALAATFLTLLWMFLQAGPLILN